MIINLTLVFLMQDDGYFMSSLKAQKFYGVSASTLRRWADSNKIESKRTPSNYRTYFISLQDGDSIKSTSSENSQNYIYCRVSSSKQSDDLERQIKYMSGKFPNHTIIRDIGSGLNYKRRGLLKLLELSNKRLVNEIVISSKDRLCRFGFELLQWQFLQNNTKLLVLEQIDKSPEQEFTEDILSILQVFACRWNGKRKYISNSDKTNQTEEINNIAEKNT
jgi:predicted site-specific integrase-resolvase